MRTSTPDPEHGGNAARMAQRADIRPPLSSLKLPVFALAHLQEPTDTTLQQLAQAITELGAFAVTPARRFDNTHMDNILQDFVSCVQGGHLDGELNQVEMADHTLRRTLATATNASMPQRLALPTVGSCPRFARSASSLRAAVAATGQAYARVLDVLMYGDAACAAPAQCFTAAVRDGESLEHFHLFQHPVRRRDDEPGSMGPAHSMLSMHSDIGLFLVMTHGMYFGGNGHAARDLRIALRDGRVVEPVFPRNALLVMNGEGLGMWMHRSTTHQVLPWSPLHEVLSSGLGGGVRAWFGRMYFPTRSAVLQAGPGAHALTFNAYRQQTYGAFKEGRGANASAAGCSPLRQLLTDEGSCAADEVYCWHSCMPITSSLTCSKDSIVCKNVNDGKIWPADYMSPGSSQPGHCYDCALSCPANSSGSGTHTSRSSFCNTELYATSMWMGGFQFAAGHESAPCVVYLFSAWVLDTRTKFAFACVGTFFMGLAVGLLTALRMRLRGRWQRQGSWDPAQSPAWSAWVCDAALIAIIAVQITLGYFLMLVAMTYQAELFIMVVLGLALGHIFTRSSPSHKPSAPSGKGAGVWEDQQPLEPCCAA